MLVQVPLRKVQPDADRHESADREQRSCHRFAPEE
jgi:hypothetical protein